MSAILDFAHYRAVTNTSFNNTTERIVNFDTAVFASANVTTGVSWVYTVPSDGVLLVTSRIAFNGDSDFDVNEIVRLKVGKNAERYLLSESYFQFQTTSPERHISGSISLDVLASDTISIYGQVLAGGFSVC